MLCVYGLFKPSMALELGLNALKEKGFAGERLAVVVLGLCAPGKQTLLDSMYRADGMSLVDGIAIGASIGMLFGVIYGSVVFIGPIALGLLGFVAGGGVGYLLDRGIQKQRSRRKSAPSGEIIVVACCRNMAEAELAKISCAKRRPAPWAGGLTGSKCKTGMCEIPS